MKIGTSRRMLAVALLACLGLAACGHSPQYALQSVSGLLPDLSFQLTDDNGQPVTARNYRGEVVLLYFGYTHCPDVCPTTLALLRQSINALGPQASRVRVLFVSVDPQRDTAALLKQYTSSFGPEFVGLRGSDSELLPLAKRYRIAFHREPADQYGNYAVDHSSAVFFFDQNGRARLLTAGNDSSASITHDLKLLLGG